MKLSLRYSDPMQFASAGSQFRLLIAHLVLLGLATCGCAWHGSKPASTGRTGGCEIAPLFHLNQVAVGQRPSISWTELPELHGEPLEIAEASVVRLLSWSELQVLAPKADTTTRLLGGRPNSPCNDASDGCWSRAAAFQSKHAAQQAVARSGEAYLGLQESYLQNELLLTAQKGSEQHVRMLEKFRSNGLSLPLDSREVDRQQLELNSQFALLAREYQTATTGLELLLNLERQPTQPIWPSESMPELNIPEELPECLASGLANRADRQALLQLACCVETAPLEKLRSISSLTSPWAGLLLPLPEKTLLGCIRTDSEQAIREQLRQQLCDLIAENEKQVQLEVNLAFASRWEAREQLAIQSELLASLKASLADFEALREIEQPDIKRYFELTQRIVTAESKLISAVIVRAKADLALARAVGGLKVD